MLRKMALVLIAIGLSHITLAADQTPTKIIKFMGSPGGQTTKEGHCWTNSIAAPRPDAWRCMAGNEILDPCFETTDRGLVQCVPDPVTGDKGVRFKLNQPLPKPDIQAGVETQGSGWLIQLTDGTVCRPATGARGQVNGKMVSCYCEGKKQNVVLLDELDTRSPTWMAEKAILVDGPDGPKLLKTQKVAVKTVWK